MAVFGLIIGYIKAAKREYADYKQLQRIMDQLRVTRRTVTRKLALNALNAAKSVSYQSENNITFV